MKTDHKLFFAIPFDSATKNLYDRISRRIRKRYPAVTAVIGKQEVGPSPQYSDIASFKAQNRSRGGHPIFPLSREKLSFKKIRSYNASRIWATRIHEAFFIRRISHFDELCI